VPLVTPTLLDHAVALVLAVFFPLRAVTFGYRRLQLAAPERIADVRLSLYRQAILLQWLFSAGVVLLWASQDRPWAALGLVVRPGWPLLAISGAVAAIAVIVLWQRAQVLRDDEALASVRDRLHHVERMLPRTPTQLRWFYWLSLTAGVCEELLYRGYLIWYFAHWLGPYGSVVVAAAVFGVGHAYQGVRGILTTAGAGLVLGVAYRVSGSLLPGMVLHALGDMHSGHLAHEALRRPRVAEAEGAPVPPSSESGADSNAASTPFPDTPEAPPAVERPAVAGLRERDDQD
jgi:membrane protease YdiL (CAAX protease family)